MTFFLFTGISTLIGGLSALATGVSVLTPATMAAEQIVKVGDHCCKLFSANDFKQWIYVHFHEFSLSGALVLHLFPTLANVGKPIRHQVDQYLITILRPISTV